MPKSMPNAIDDNDFPLTFAQLEQRFPKLAYDFKVYLEENDEPGLIPDGLFYLEEPEFVEHTYEVVPSDLFYVNGQPKVFTYADKYTSLFWTTAEGRPFWGDLT